MSKRIGQIWALDDDQNPYPVDLKTDSGMKAYLDTVENKKTVAREVIRVRDNESYIISTVFLLTDHCFDKDGPPILYETMVFFSVMDASKQDSYPLSSECEWRPDPANADDWHGQDRYTSRTAALLGHGKAVNAVRNGRVRKEDSDPASFFRE